MIPYQVKRCFIVILLFIGLLSLRQVYADEGMWQPHQLPQLQSRLNELGLDISANDLSRLDQFPMTAIVSLGGCSASFVSPQGLIATNHHCVYGSLQHNSTPENNLITNGFLARKSSEELHANPQARVYVTEALTDATQAMLAGIAAQEAGLSRYQKLEDNKKKLIKQCEQSGIHRCNVVAFHHGLEYQLIKRLEIRDVRLVYAPSDKIGGYGGDIDNWMWPRHTGDFGFYRAYVGKDGKPADYHKDNVPYQNSAYLKISAQDLSEDDFVMVIGYPGSTNRYRHSEEIKSTFEWYYPFARRLREDIISVIETTSSTDEKAKVAYKSIIVGLSNYAKNFASMEQSYRNSSLLTRRSELEKTLEEAYQKEAASAENPISELGKLVVEHDRFRERDVLFQYLRYADMPKIAMRLYRFSLEQQKPDHERELGYQKRNHKRFKNSLQRITRSFNASVDQAILAYWLQRYQELPAEQRLQSFDQYFKQSGKALDKQLSKMYKRTKLVKEAERLAWMQRTPTEFEKSRDPFIRLAVASYKERYAMEIARKTFNGNKQLWQPRYMQALIDYKKQNNEPVYSDANSTLRISVGQVKGNRPKDGMAYLPFTTLAGVAAKHTGTAPFDAPQQLLELNKNKHYGPYASKTLGTLPVNYLTTLDITGGNSGSAALNNNLQLCGLLFDGTYESIIADWDFTESTRSIAVDSRYMLWVMKYIDKADRILEEMEIVY